MRIFVFNDKSLARRFKEDRVSQNERFVYFLIVSALYAFSGTSWFISIVYAAEVTAWDMLLDGLIMVTTLVGTTICYRTNMRGDRKEFIERMTCIGFPVAIKSFLLLMCIVIIAIITSLIIESESLCDSPLMSFLGINISYLYYFWRLNSAIGVAAGAQ